MKYKNVVPATFLERPNRFIARVELEGKIETVHVKNTGRCRELLIPGSRVYLSVGDNPERKTKYDLVAVEKARENAPPLLINMDSSAPNSAASEWLAGGLFSSEASVYPEVKYRNSRFDFYVEDGSRRAYVEVKGVTLEENGVVRFPDAPTLRGVKHLNELCECIKDGFEAYALFVIQMNGASLFQPNDITHSEFGEALRACDEQGVKIIAMDCRVTPDGMKIDSPVRIDLSRK